jgi:hypothetical protein
MRWGAIARTLMNLFASAGFVGFTASYPSLFQQLWKLRNIECDPSRLVHGQLLCRDRRAFGRLRIEVARAWPIASRTMYPPENFSSRQGAGKR